MGAALWSTLIVMGLVIGGAHAFFARQSKMPPALSFLIALIGVCAGGALVEIVKPEKYAGWMFYATGAGLSIALLVGGTLAYELTLDDRRV